MPPVNFDEFRLLFPPRASASINPKTLTRYKGYWAQYKYNDSRTLVYVYPDGHAQLFNRHKEEHVMYKMTESMRQSIRELKLPQGKFHVLDGGLLHNKTRNIKDRIVLWDILVFDGEYLIGTTYSSRYGLLAQTAGQPKTWEMESGRELALSINHNLWLAPVFLENFLECYQTVIPFEEIEGLVLKNPNGKLEWATKEDNNESWQIRVRKPNPNYSF